MSTTPVVAVATPVVKPNGAAKVNQPTYAQLAARVAELEAAKNAPGKLTIRINDAVNPETGVQGKGTICIYGLGKFPFSAYAEQWERILTVENIKTILELCKNPRASRKVR